MVVFLLLPEAVTACLILAGPFLRLDDEAFSAFVILAATALGRHEGYGRLDSPFFADLRPQGLPVLTSTHSSLNHFLRAAPFLLFLTATFVTPIFSAYLATLSHSARCVSRGPDFVSSFDLSRTRIVCLLFLFSSHYIDLRVRLRTAFFGTPAGFFLRPVPPEGFIRVLFFFPYPYAILNLLTFCGLFGLQSLQT